MSSVKESERGANLPETQGGSGAMTVESVMIPTGTAHPSMTVRDLFDLCGRDHVQALPFIDASGQIAGRVTLKNILRVSCLPEYMVEMAPLLNSKLSCVENAEEKAREIICNLIEPYVQTPPQQSISSSAPLIKALAMMEKNDTSYIFVVEDGVFRGVVTIQGIAAKMAELAVCEPGR